jgi:hypothetical protein
MMTLSNSLIFNEYAAASYVRINEPLLKWYRGKLFLCDYNSTLRRPGSNACFRGGRNGDRNCLGLEQHATVNF